MSIATLNQYENKGILTKKRLFERDEYRLKRPVKILIRKQELASLSTIYRKTNENGGLLIFEADCKTLKSKKFIEVPNLSASRAAYQPNQALFNFIAQKELADGNLPMAIHTHPTELGFSQYDNKRANFYLKSSRADRIVANAGITDLLEMPEGIFVKDSRFAKGFEISLFQGTVFPQSIQSISDLQLGLAGILGVSTLFSKLSKPLFFIILAAFLIDLFRRPRYTYFDDGNLEILLSI